MEDSDSFDMDMDDEFTEFNIEESEFLPPTKKTAPKKQEEAKSR